MINVQNQGCNTISAKAAVIIPVSYCLKLGIFLPYNLRLNQIAINNTRLNHSFLSIIVLLLRLNSLYDSFFGKNLNRKNKLSS